MVYKFECRFVGMGYLVHGCQILCTLAQLRTVLPQKSYPMILKLEP